MAVAVLDKVDERSTRSARGSKRIVQMRHRLGGVDKVERCHVARSMNSSRQLKFAVLAV